MKKDESISHTPLPRTANRENLQKLIGILRSGSFDPIFDMATFYSKKSCGTFACAAGCGIIAIKGFNENMVKPNYNWSGDITSVFGFSSLDNEKLFDYLFSWFWYDSDNTITGAANRIEYVLLYGVPSNYMKQMFGEAPLSYHL